MNKVTTINLNGRAYQLEEGGEAVLRKYLETAATKLAGNPDKDEIMADFEQAIADKFDQKLNGHKNVVTEKEIEEIIAAMGPVEGAGGSAESASPPDTNQPASDPHSGSGQNAGAPKRLYRIPAGEWIMGVCNGLAAYFNIDVTLMRIIWIVLAIITHGFWIAAYIILAIVMPPVRSEEQFAAAHGWTTRPPFNANDFIEETKKRYAEWRAELEKMHEDHKAKEYGAKATGATGVATAAGATAAGDATAVGADATAKQTKEDMKAWAKKMKAEMKMKKQQMKHEWRQQRHDWHQEWRQNRHADRNAYMNNNAGGGYGGGHGGYYGPGSDEYNARRYGAGYGISRAIFGFFAVLVSIVLLAAAAVWALTLYTLIKYGTVFGYAIGAGHPLWVSIVFLCAAFYIVTVPFRMILHHAWGSGHYQSGWSDFGRGIIFLAVCAVLIYTARELFPQVNDWWNVSVAWLNARR